MDSDHLVLVLVIGARLLVPLLVFRYPLPAILACLVIDGVDQTIFQRLTDLPLDNYQSYDKALDIYYLSLAYMATLRNWTHTGAFEIGRFLWYYRLVGVLAFELSDDARILLLIFPNTFEYFFIAYEALRTRFDPAARNLRFWLLLAAGIWVFVKLPQEWWIHVAQIDTTDLIREHPWVGVLMAVGVLVLLAVGWFVVRPRLGPPDHTFQLAAGPLPAEMDSGAERAAWTARQPLWSPALLELVFLVAVVCTIFASILPGVEVALLGLSAAVAVVVVTNVALGQLAARRGWAARGTDSAFVEFAVLAVLNSTLVAVAAQLAGRDLRVAPTLFFVLLVTLIVTTYDRYRPVHEARITGGGRPRQR